MAEALDGVAHRAAAERLVTAGHATWRAGEASHALELFDRAAGRDPRPAWRTGPAGSVV